ncbi:hypothetical protein M3Y97_01081400 [Aphelenchoides bicaudatus]|nr:hypothetical protein M3Y97_01081400 [Aphelenchoides bicaudatus]
MWRKFGRLKRTILIVFILFIFCLHLNGFFTTDRFDIVYESGETRLDKVDWFIVDTNCLERLATNQACHAPIKIASYKTAKFSALFKLTHQIHMDLEKDYLTLQPIGNDGDVIRLLARDIAVRTLTPIKLTNGEPQEANVASNPLFFKRQWQNGRRLECQPRYVSGTTKKKTRFYEDPKIPTEKIYLFGVVRRQMQVVEAIPFLISGTLLGWYRECSLIVHTADVDFALQPSDSSNPLVVQTVRDRHRMIHILGDQQNSSSALEVSFRFDDVPIDMFLMQRLNETHDYFQVFRLSSTSPQRHKALFPTISELCAGDMHGFLIYVPCNVEDVLKAEFNEWRHEIHTENYSYLKAPNLQQDTNFTKEEFAKNIEHFYWQAFFVQNFEVFERLGTVKLSK